MRKGKSTFALFFGNRGFFPSAHVSKARKELSVILNRMGHKTLMMPEESTNFGAVETTREGQLYAQWLNDHKGKFQGVVLCLPNFGDETGAVAALKEAGVPIFVQAYPDDPDKMGPATRRDSFCGKISIMDVFCQYGVPFTATTPHTVAPSSHRFAENMRFFDSVCRVVGGVRGMTVGAIGARTTPFKTVRIDETALQAHGITVETLDMSDVFAKLRSVVVDDIYRTKAEGLKMNSCWDNVPEDKFDNIVKLSVVLDSIAEEYQMDALALRCWAELQTELGISPCIVMGILNEQARPVACEVDVGNAVAMYALALASDGPVGLLDWNNNYGDEDDKCILFHCGSMPPAMMTKKGTIVDHAILANAVGQQCSYGCNVGRIAPTDFTFASLMTSKGRVKCYLGEGTFTDDTISDDFFGCAGVAEIPNLQKVLLHIGYGGHRHHVSVTAGRYRKAMVHAFGRYLGFEVATPQDSEGSLP